MEEQSNQIQIADEKKFDTFANAIKTAVEATRNYWRVKEKICELEEKRASNDKVALWNTLQDYIRQYSFSIKTTSVVTGFTVVYTYYDSITVDELKQQLEQMKFIIMYAEIMKTAARQVFKEHLKSVYNIEHSDKNQLFSAVKI